MHEVIIDTDAKTIQAHGLSCWAGRGDCTALPFTTTIRQYYARGDAKLQQTGYFTEISIDRRSGMMKFNQFVEPGSQFKPLLTDVQEKGEYVCQGGTDYMF